MHCLWIGLSAGPKALRANPPSGPEPIHHQALFQGLHLVFGGLPHISCLYGGTWTINDFSCLELYDLVKIVPKGVQEKRTEVLENKVDRM